MGRASWRTEALSARPGLGVNCYMPANGETVTLPTSPSIPVGISLGLLKREMAQGMRGRVHRAGWGGPQLSKEPLDSSNPCPLPLRAAPQCQKAPAAARHPDHEGQRECARMGTRWEEGGFSHAL